MVGDLRMWLYRAHPGNPRRCAGADHSLQATGRSQPRSGGSILSRAVRETRTRMSDLLTDIRGEISARLEELRPAVTEYTQLQEARAALTGTGSTAKRQPGGPSTYARSGGNSGRDERPAPERSELELTAQFVGARQEQAVSSWSRTPRY
jgi:hypothetical protein